MNLALPKLRVLILFLGCFVLFFDLNTYAQDEDINADELEEEYEGDELNKIFSKIPEAENKGAGTEKSEGKQETSEEIVIEDVAPANKSPTPVPEPKKKGAKPLSKEAIQGSGPIFTGTKE